MFRRHFRTSLWLWVVCFSAACFGLLLIASMQRAGSYNYLRSQLIAAGVGFLFDGLTGLFTVFTVAHAKSTFERLQAAAPVIELEPGSAEPVAVNGNTADTPAIEAAQESAEEAAESTPEGMPNRPVWIPL